MKRKLYTLLIISLFLITGLPIAQVQGESKTPTINKMSLAHISIKGSGTEFMIMANFMFGFGKSFFIRLNLEKNSHIEINKFLHSKDTITLEGDHIITLIGFCGYFRQANRIVVNGIAFRIFWK